MADSTRTSIAPLYEFELTAGALIGASIGERRASPGSLSQRVKEEVNERVIQPR